MLMRFKRKGNTVVNIFLLIFATIATVSTTLVLKFGFTFPEVVFTVLVLSCLTAFFVYISLPEVLIKRFFHWLLTTVYRVKVKGLENYHKAGERVVIIANHTSFLDAILLATFLPDKLTFAVNSFTAEKWWIRFFMRMVNAYPIDPTNSMAIKSLISFVSQNNRCVIFPEGRITMTGALMKIHESPGLVADKSDAKLLPIRIQGAQFTHFSRLRGKVRIRWAPKITITIFPPQTLDIPAHIKGRTRREKIGFKLYDLMTEMMFESSDYRKTLFSSLIDAKTSHGRGREIIEDTERKPTTYQQFITRCFVLGGCIAKKTEAGEHVGILLPNTTSTAITFFAMQAYYRVPAMLNHSTGIANVVLACKTANIKTIYTSRKFINVAKLNEMIDHLKEAGVKITYLEELRSSINILDKLKGILMAQLPMLSYKFITSSKANRHLQNIDTPAVILFTSGSEGTPKGVVLSHMNIQSNRCQINACVDFTSSDKVFNALPIFHSFGLTGGLLLPLLSGVRVFLYPSPLHYRIIPQLSYDTNATIIFGTDTFLSSYAKYAHQYDFYSVRYIFAGAEKLREETRFLWSQKFGVRIFEGYGTTETSPAISANTPMQNKMGTVGRLMPGIQCKIIPVPGITEGGVLAVSGPNIMQGYLLANQPGVLIPPENGWYNTGDIVTIDDMGFITIKGRVKRFAKIAGEMISLVMVEQYIYKLWPDHQHAVVSLPDAKKGEQLVLVTTNPNATREEVVSYAKSSKMADIAIPKKILILQDMPILVTGKVDYTGVKERVNALLTSDEIEEVDEEEYEN